MDFAQLLAAFRAGTLDGPGLESFRTALLSRLATPETGDNVADLITVAGEVSARITEFNTQADASQAARDQLAGLTVTQRQTQHQNGGQGGGGTQVLDRDTRGGDGADTQNRGGDDAQPVLLGRAFVESPAFRENVEGLRNRTVGKMSASIETRALFTTANYPTNNPRVPGVVIQNDQPLTFLDMVDRRPMGDSNNIEWVREDTAPNAAAEVAEGGAKPEASMVLTLVTDSAATIAHWVNITRQSLADETMLRGYIEGRLSYGLLKRLNSQIVNGNGTAPNLRGILNTVGIGTYVAGTAGEAAIISVRKAKTVAQLSEYEPDTVGMNPVDWEAIELSVDSQGSFRVSPNVQAGAPAVVWGLRVVTTTALTGTTFGTTGGTFVVGAFREGATLWERTAVEIFITDSHASNFTSNILTLLAELRAGLSVWRPKAFVKGTFGASRT